MTVLVVGARKNSIGAAIARQVRFDGGAVRTIGLSMEEDQVLDLGSSMGLLRGALATIKPRHIVVTAGVNQPETGDEDDPYDLYRWHFDKNVIYPLRLLAAWQSVLGEEKDDNVVRHYVAISSNSARLPRSNSAPYCASKAALSMALRVKAREGGTIGRATGRMAVYGYEPGLVAGTPMTAQTLAQFGSGVPLTRMRHPELSGGIPGERLASMVVNNLRMGLEMNGLLIPLDADEA